MSRKDLERDGALFVGPNGSERVSITLQLNEAVPLTRENRDEIHRKLCERFRDISHRWEPDGLVVDISTVSELSQAVRGSVLLDHFDQVREELSSKEGVRVDPVVKRQATSTSGSYAGS